METKLPISAVIITKNAAHQLDACLESLASWDEIVVVDSGSTDATVALATAKGARVIQSAWRGFGPQKQFAIEQARNDWVLCVDADERVTPELREAIDRIDGVSSAPTGESVSAYRFARRNRFMGRYLRHGEGYPDWSLRLFDRRAARWSDDAVHEKVIVMRGAVGTLTGDLLHESAESLDNYLAKQNRYSSLSAETAIANGKRANVAQLILSPLVRFVKFYFVRLGFLDGLPGLVHILIGCIASFLKYAKMLAVQRAQTETK